MSRNPKISSGVLSDKRHQCQYGRPAPGNQWEAGLLIAPAPRQSRKLVKIKRSVNSSASPLPTSPFPT